MASYTVEEPQYSVTEPEYSVEEPNEPGLLQQIGGMLAHPMTPAPGLQKVEAAIRGPQAPPETLTDVAANTAREFGARLMPTTAAGAAAFGLAGPAANLAVKAFPQLGKSLGTLGTEFMGGIRKGLAPESLTLPPRQAISGIPVSPTGILPIVPSEVSQVTKPGATTPTNAPPAVVASNQTPLPPAVTAPEVSLDVYRKVTNAAKSYQQANPKDVRPPDMRVSDWLAFKLWTGEITPNFLAQHGLAEKEFAVAMRQATGDAARRMNFMSQLVERGAVTKEEAAAAMKLPTEDVIDIEPRGLLRRISDAGRALAVTMPITAMRNFLNQLSNVGMDATRSPVDWALQRAAGFIKPGYPVTTRPLDGVEVAMRIFSRQTKPAVDAILEHFPEAKDRLLGTYSADLLVRTDFPGAPAMKATMNALSYLNKTQEFIIRRGVFLANLDQGISRYGRSLDNVLETVRKTGEAPDLPAGLLKQPIDRALDVTLARTPPYGSFWHHIIGAINAIPFVPLGTIPYPRFLYNASKFQWEWNPSGFLNLLSRAERNRIANGDTSALSKAIVGSTLFYTGWQLVNSKYMGSKWYLLQQPSTGYSVDIRPYWPLSSYVFFPWLIKQIRDGTAHNLKARDLVEGFLSMSGPGGVGMYVFDHFLDTLHQEKVIDKIKAYGAGALSMYLMPLRAVVDAVGQFDRDHRVVRDVRDEPFLGPLKSNIPVATTTLPAAARPTRTGDVERVDPLLAQVSGFRPHPPDNPAEREINRFNIHQGDWFPSTGVPAADRSLARIVAPAVETGVSNLVQSSSYRNLKTEQQEWLLRLVLNKLVSSKTAQAAVMSSPELSKEQKAQWLLEHTRNLNESTRRAFDLKVR